MKLSTDVTAQLRMLITAMSAGGGLALFRDILTLLIPKKHGALALLREGSVAAAAFRILFEVGLRTGQGLGLALLCAALAGFLFYYGLLHSAASAAGDRIKQFLRVGK